MKSYMIAIMMIYNHLHLYAGALVRPPEVSGSELNILVTNECWNYGARSIENAEGVLIEMILLENMDRYVLRLLTLLTRPGIQCF